MRAYVAAFIVALLVSAALTPIVRRMAFRLGAVSHPGGRHIHEKPTPRMGGLAICIALVAPLVGLFFVQSTVAAAFTSERSKVAGLLAGGAVMCGVGVIDDSRGMRALHKLYAQIAVACFAFACGFRIESVLLPFIGHELSMGIFALPITTLWIVGLVNAVNLIDGLDGLAAGVVFFAGLTNFVVALLTGSPFVALLMAATLGAVMGFWFYNFNPARIFMGDSGSYFLGYVLAVTSLTSASQKASTAVSLLVPIVALGIPIFDTLFAMVRRFLERRPLFSPDRGHIHHRLLDMGITHRRAVLIIYGVSVVFTGLAIAISLGRSWSVGLALLAASVVGVGLIKFVGYFDYLRPERRAARLRPEECNRLRHALPKVPVLLSQARSEAEVFAALGAVGAEAELEFIDVIEGGAEEREGAASMCVWMRGEGTDRARHDMLTASYALGGDEGARAHLRFGWRSALGDVSPQADILLQVIADVAAAHLGRMRSRFAPRAEGAVEDESSGDEAAAKVVVPEEGVAAPR